MKHIIIALTTFALMGCGGKVTDKINETTGTTLEQRCAQRYARIEAWESGIEQGIISKDTTDELAKYKLATVFAGCVPT